MNVTDASQRINDHVSFASEMSEMSELRSEEIKDGQDLNKALSDVAPTIDYTYVLNP